MTCFSLNNPVENFQTAASAHWDREGGLAIENISDAKHLRCHQCQTGTVTSNQSWGSLQAPRLTSCPSLVSLGAGTPVSSLLMCWERGQVFLESFLVRQKPSCTLKQPIEEHRGAEAEDSTEASGWRGQGACLHQRLSVLPAFPGKMNTLYQCHTHHPPHASQQQMHPRNLPILSSWRI